MRPETNSGGLPGISVPSGTRPPEAEVSQSTAANVSRKQDCLVYFADFFG